MTPRSAACGVALALALALGSSARAQTAIEIVVADGPSEGFNDPTPVAPVGGNPGLTLGEQRRIVFEEAAAIWGALLQSDVPVQVEARFDPLACSRLSATLGSAGPTTVHRDFPGASAPATWHPQALANSLAGTDLAPTTPDLGATFNSAIDANDDCLVNTDWYLGLDGQSGGDVDLLDVVVHEIGHGLGFLSFVNAETGARFLGLDDVFMRHLWDGGVGLTWDQLSDAERTASAVSGDLRWIGEAVVAASEVLSQGVDASGAVQMYAPATLAPGSSVSHWDVAVTPDELMEPFISADPIQDPGLALELMRDLGWSAAPVACAGDVDGDGSTSAEDFGILGQNFGRSVAPGTDGDLDGDGVVGATDFAILSADFGCSP